MDDAFGFSDDQDPRFPERVPLFRLWRTPALVPLLHLQREVGPGDVEHFYTASPEERDEAIRHHRYVLAGVACLVHGRPAAGSVPLFRLWHAPTRHHAFTTDPANVSAARALGTFHYDGVAAYVFPNPVSSAGTVPLHALVHRARYAHLYTTDEAERDAAVAAGAEALGIACWVYPAEAHRDGG